MKLTLPLGLAWRLAAGEAIAGDFKEIQPAHLCMALLKASEITGSDLQKIIADPSASANAVQEIDELRELIEARRVDSTRLRRRLRAALGNGGHVHAGDIVHRSKECKALFEAAVELAERRGAEALRTHHVLETLVSSSVPTVSRLLRESPKHAPVPRDVLPPLLTRHATELPAGGTAAVDKPHEPSPACRALMEAVGNGSANTVFLVTDDCEFAGQVVREAANGFGRNADRIGGGTPRVFEVSETIAEECPDRTPLGSALADLLEEAAQVHGIWLYLSSAVPDAGDGETRSRIDEIHRASTNGGPVLICRIDPDVYKRHAAGDRAWRARTRALWLHRAVPKAIPDRL